MSKIFRQSSNATSWDKKVERYYWLKALLDTWNGMPPEQQDPVYMLVLHTKVRHMREKLYATR